MTPRLDGMQYQHITDIDRFNGNGISEKLSYLPQQKKNLVVLKNPDGNPSNTCVKIAYGNDR